MLQGKENTVIDAAVVNGLTTGHTTGHATAHPTVSPIETRHIGRCPNHTGSVVRYGFPAFALAQRARGTTRCRPSEAGPTIRAICNPRAFRAIHRRRTIDEKVQEL